MGTLSGKHYKTCQAQKGNLFGVLKANRQSATSAFNEGIVNGVTVADQAFLTSYFFFLNVFLS